MLEKIAPSSVHGKSFNSLNEFEGILDHFEFINFWKYSSIEIKYYVL